MTDQTPRRGDAGDQPVDLYAVGRDDAFLDALANGKPVNTADAAEYELAGLLTMWRNDTLSTAMPAEPSVDDVERAIAASRKRNTVARNLRLVSGAAAIMAVAAAGLLVLSENSQPGDPLWNVKKVVFAEQAQQTQAKVDVQSDLEAAEAAFAAGDVEHGTELLNRAEKALGPVGDRDTVERMQRWIARLRDDAPTSTAKSSAKSSAPSTSDAASVPSSVTDTTPPRTSTTVTVKPTKPTTPPPSTPPSTTTTTEQPQSSSEQPSAMPGDSAGVPSA